MSASPGRHETEPRRDAVPDERCGDWPAPCNCDDPWTHNGHGSPTAAPLGDEGETERRWRVGTHYGIHVYEGERPVATFHNSGDAARAVAAVNETPPVVPDQPEETDTVNDELPAWWNEAGAVAWTKGGRMWQRNTSGWQLPMLRALYDDEHVAARGVVTVVRPLGREVWTKLATSPAVGAEVRVEWGVQYELFTGDAWRPGYLEVCDDRDEAEQRRQTIADRAPGLWRNPELLSRTVHERKSPWVPVTDEQEKR